jgi:hypothetical protein
VTETIRYTLIGKEDIKLSPRDGTFTATLADGRQVTLSALDVALLVSDAAAEASLPTSGIATGQLHRVTDKGHDIRVWNGSAWVSVTKITTRGDIVRGGASGPERLEKGAAGRFLSSDGTDVAWGQGPLTTTGDLLVGSSTGTPTRLAVGTASQVLVGGSSPSWGSVPSGALPAASTTAVGGVELATKAEMETGTDAARVPSVSVVGHLQGVAKAWVNFNGTGVVAIRDSYNVASITDNGTGDYSVNFSSAFAAATYAAAGFSARSATIAGGLAMLVSQSTTAYRAKYTGADLTTAVDHEFVDLAFYGEQ